MYGLWFSPDGDTLLSVGRRSAEERIASMLILLFKRAGALQAYEESLAIMRKLAAGLEATVRGWDWDMDPSHFVRARLWSRPRRRCRGTGRGPKP